MNILYVYDEPNWALHNVGKYWASVLGSDYRFTFIRRDEHERYDPREFNCVFWGCAGMPMGSRPLLLWRRLFPGDYKVWLAIKDYTIISVIHDPCEIFPQRESWRHAQPRLRHLRRYARLAVTSNEMQRVMRELGYDCLRISTNSTLELRDPVTINEEPLKIVTKANNHRRKNLPMFRELQAAYRSRVARFDAYIGLYTLPEPEYIRLIDEYNCYLCTSWQEGGPLPLMDAMRRGCAVLTTPVGQTDELVQDGFNGFFCKTRSGFAERIEFLAGRPDLLYDMRLNSLKVSAERTGERVREQLAAFLAR